jgi:hypothetical protein
MHDETVDARPAGEAPGASPGKPRMWRRMAAQLAFDSRRQPRVAGTRAVGLGHPRLMYEIDGVEIDLEVRPSSIAGRLRLLGQVTADDSDLARASVMIDGVDGRLETGVDDLGLFSFDGLVSGGHRMEVGLNRALIEIPSLYL